MKYVWIFFGFDGRISRKTYWLASLALLILGFPADMIGDLLDKVFGTTPIQNLSFYSGLGPIRLAVSLAFIYPGLAVFVKRLHDRNKGARWLLLQLIPVIGTVWLVIETGFLKGTVGPNDWGDDPFNPSPPAAEIADQVAN